MYGMFKKPQRPRYSYATQAPVMPGSNSRKSSRTARKAGGAKRPAGAVATATRKKPPQLPETKGQKRPPSEKPS